MKTRRHSKKSSTRRRGGVRGQNKYGAMTDEELKQAWEIHLKKFMESMNDGSRANSGYDGPALAKEMDRRAKAAKKAAKGK